MRPAFATSRQAAAFAFLLSLLLLLPLLVGKSFLPSRSQIYSSIWWANGDFPYFYQQFYEEKGDIDIAFVGSSHLWNGINTRYVQEQLSKQLGRPAIVRTLGWGGSGSDALYYIVQDLLQNRKVKLLVLDDDCSPLNTPHLITQHWFRWGDNAEDLGDLSVRLKAMYYFASIIGMPHTLLELIRSNVPANLQSKKETYYQINANALNPVSELGASTTRLGFRPTRFDAAESFQEYMPQINKQPSAVSIYNPETARDFYFSATPLPSLQTHFLRLLGSLTKEKGSKLAVIHIPTYDERRSRVIQEELFWPTVLHTDLTIFGIPPSVLFETLSDADIRKLFADPAHLNQNGQSYFTRTITPRLLQIYATQVTP